MAFPWLKRKSERRRSMMEGRERG